MNHTKLSNMEDYSWLRCAYFSGHFFFFFCKSNERTLLTDHQFIRILHHLDYFSVELTSSNQSLFVLNWWFVHEFSCMENEFTFDRSWSVMHFIRPVNSSTQYVFTVLMIRSSTIWPLQETSDLRRVSVSPRENNVMVSKSFRYDFIIYVSN